MDAAPDIVALPPTPKVIAALADIVVEAVATGASVSFLHPLAPEVAAAFWTSRSPLPKPANAWFWARWKRANSRGR